MNEKLNYSTDLHKKLKKDADDLTRTELSLVSSQYPVLYDKIVEGVDRATLENVLTAFEAFQSGKISANDAVSTGMDYMTNRYNLPANFFNKQAIDQFNHNLHKLS